MTAHLASRLSFFSLRASDGFDTTSAVLQFLVERIHSPFILDWLIWTTPQGSLVRLCHHVKRQNGHIGHGVMKLSAKVAVKYGPIVSAGEAATQAHAYQHTDGRIVRVPRVYRYLHDQSDPLSMADGWVFVNGLRSWKEA